MKFRSAVLAFLVSVLASPAAWAQEATADSTQEPFLSSVPSGMVSRETLRLTLREAIDRGLQSNLGLLLSGQETQVARGNRWQALSRLLPVAQEVTSGSQQEINLHALIGPNIPSSFAPIAGPFHVLDTRAYLSVPLLNLSALHAERSATHNLAAANFSYKHARDTVVLAVGNAYLVANAGKARVAAATAESNTAEALYQLAQDREQAGLSPEIDTLRAQVELKSRQEALLAAQNDYATEKLNLARAIGLPDAQTFTLATTVPYQPMENITLDEALARAYQNRGAYQAARAAVAAAQAARRAALAERLPSIDFNANWSETGLAPSYMHQTYQIAGTLRIPIFQGGRVRGELVAANARLREKEFHLRDLKEQIDYEVRTALLNLKTNADQVTVAQSNTGLAAEALVQAQDRFRTGVADNIEVVQAQQAVAQADEAYIASLYRYNLSKLALARGMGVAERDVFTVLGDNKP